MTEVEKADKSRALYFLAILPPLDLQEEINAFKEVAKRDFQSSRSLNSPPHITLIPPFWFRHSEEDALLIHLKKFNQEMVAFPLELSDFGSFPPRAIYVNVVENTQLTNCQNSLRAHFEDLQLGLLQRFGFHAHITIAYKDLTPSMFPKAEEFFQSLSYRRSFEGQEVALLRLRNKKWKLIKT